MKSSPRNFRLTTEGLQALKILEGASANSPRGEVVSKALMAAAKTTVAAKPVSFRLLDPAAFLHIQAGLSEIEALHRNNREALLKIRPGDKNQAEKLAQAIQRIDDETSQLAHLRRQLANLARTTESLTAEDHKILATLINWTKARIGKADEKQRPVYELELRLLQSFIP